MAHALQFGGSCEGEEAIRRTRVKALNFDGSGESEESIRRTSVKTQHFGDVNGKEAAIRTRGNDDRNKKRNTDAKKINSVGRRARKGK